MQQHSLRGAAFFSRHVRFLGSSAHTDPTETIIVSRYSIDKLGFLWRKS